MTHIPPAATDPATAAYQIRALFVPDGDDGRHPTEPPLENEELITIITATLDRDTVRTRLYAQMQQRVGVDSTEAIDAEYDLKWTAKEFHDEPWETEDELESALVDIEGVTSAMYCPPYHDTACKPPHYKLFVTGNANEDEVAKTVNQYYPGLTPSVDTGQVEVIACPYQDS